MEFLKIVPHVNAFLNASSGVFLILGFYFILSKKTSSHRFCMLTACLLSASFLVFYIAHHSVRTYYFGLGPTKFTGEGIIRPVYLTILTTHTILATLVAPFVLVTLRRALKGKFAMHKRLARIIFPIWLFVSITGVIVYLLLYQFFPGR